MNQDDILLVIFMCLLVFSFVPLLWHRKTIATCINQESRQLPGLHVRYRLRGQEPPHFYRHTFECQVNGEFYTLRQLCFIHWPMQIGREYTVFACPGLGTVMTVFGIGMRIALIVLMGIAIFFF
jgi:hypothetical protein